MNKNKKELFNCKDDKVNNVNNKLSQNYIQEQKKKLCPRCKERKTFDCFGVRVNENLRGWCLECEREDRKELKKLIARSKKIKHKGNSYISIIFKGKNTTRSRAVIMVHFNCILPKEIHIHHINGKIRDDRLQNLAILRDYDHFSLHSAGKIKMENEYKKAIKESGGWGRSYINWNKFIELTKLKKEITNKEVHNR